MIGTSLPLGVLTDNPATEADKALLDAYGGHRALLPALKALGVGSIELRTVKPDTPPKLTEAVAGDILSAGLYVTIHATLTDDDAPVFFKPLMPALKAAQTAPRPMPLTVHSLRTGSEPLDQSGTVRLLRVLSDYIEEKGLNACLALENNRIHREGLSIMDCDGVSDTVRQAKRKRVGACFDLGHLYSNFLTWPRCTAFLPPEAFLRQVIHTHIHGVTHTTHCPLTEGTLPLEDYLRPLIACGYEGIFNLELECGRFWRDTDPREGFESSVRRLKACLEKLGVRE